MKTLFENNMDMMQPDMFTIRNKERFEIVDWLFMNIEVKNAIGLPPTLINKRKDIIQNIECKLKPNKIGNIELYYKKWEFGEFVVTLKLFNVDGDINTEYYILGYSIPSGIITTKDLTKMEEIMLNSLDISIPKELCTDILNKTVEISNIIYKEFEKK